MKFGYIKYILILLVLVLPLQVAADSNLLGSSVNNNEYVGNNDDEYDNRDEGPGVILYRHARFKGSNIFVPSGQDIRDLRSEDFNDEISSLEIIGGATVIIFEHKNYTGASAKITRSVVDMVKLDTGVPGSNWNDRISSIRVFGGRGYYSHDQADDTNIYCVFYDNDQPNSPSFNGKLGKHEEIKKKWNDRISVVWLKRGYILTLFEHSDFKGEELVLEGKALRDGAFYNLEDYGFNNKGSSYILEKSRRH
jgi:hypothetical protein